METSLFLARLIGPSLVVVAAGMLLRPESFRIMARQFIASPALVYLAGFLTLLAGLALVLTHNVWSGGWPVVITILGWLSVFAGIIRLIFPETILNLGNRMLDSKAAFTAIGVVEGLIGLWLSYAGYLA